MLRVLFHSLLIIAYNTGFIWGWCAVKKGEGMPWLLILLNFFIFSGLIYQ